MPKVVDHIVKSFKLNKVLKYVEKPNDADKKIEELEERVKRLEDILFKNGILLPKIIRKETDPF